MLGNTFHLWLRPGLDVIDDARRPAPLHGLERPDPDRLRRLPGVLAGHAAQDHRGGRALRLADQRRPAAADARGVDAHPDGARFRHRDDLRRMHAVRDRRTPGDGTRGGRLDAAVAALGAAQPRRVRRAGRGARHEHKRALFGIVQGGMFESQRDESLDGLVARRLRRLRDRRPVGRRAEGGHAAHARTRRTAPAARISRAT